MISTDTRLWTTSIFGTMNLSNLDFILQNVYGINIGATGLVNVTNANFIASTLPINLTSTNFGWVSGDSDYSVYAYTGAGAGSVAGAGVGIDSVRPVATSSSLIAVV